jgi:transposase InsO family protein
VPGAAAAAPNALSAGERSELLAILDSPRFADKAPRQVWAVLIDEGTYLASVSTMYRLLRGAGQVRERRAQAAHPARTKPELIAAGPNEVWPWDITKLTGPGRGVYYHLYVMIDIFSRCAVHFEVHATELGELAKDFMTEAVRLNSGTAPLAIHADRGTSMTSKTVSALLSDRRSSNRIRGRRSAMTTRTARRSSRRSSTARLFLACSGRCRTPARSAACSSPTTTMSTGIPGSGCIPRTRSISAPRPRSRTSARPC